MLPRAAEIALQRLVSDLARQHPDDREAILESLDAPYRAQVEALLERHLSRDLRTTPVFDAMRLSPRLLAIIKAGPTARITAATADALTHCASELFPVVLDAGPGRRHQ